MIHHVKLISDMYVLVQTAQDSWYTRKMQTTTLNPISLGLRCLGLIQSEEAMNNLSNPSLVSQDKQSPNYKCKRNFKWESTGGRKVEQA